MRFNTTHQSNSAAINSRVIYGLLRSVFVLLCGSFFLFYTSFISFLRLLLTAVWRNWHSGRPTDILTAGRVHSGFTSLMKTAFRSQKCEALNVADRKKKQHTTNWFWEWVSVKKQKREVFFCAFLWARIKRDRDVSCILDFEHLNVAAWSQLWPFTSRWAAFCINKM